MKKRLQSILAAFMVVFLLFVECTPIAGAVAPIALVEAALASYVASTGYKLWIDNGTGADVIGLIESLYETYLETHPETQTLLALAQGNFISYDNSGNILINQLASNIFQDFSDWIATEYTVTPGAGQPTTVVNNPSGLYSNGVVTAYLYVPGQQMLDLRGSSQMYQFGPASGTYVVAGTSKGAYFVASAPVRFLAFTYSMGGYSYVAVSPVGNEPSSFSFNTAYSQLVNGEERYVGISTGYSMSYGQWRKIRFNSIPSQFSSLYNNGVVSSEDFGSVDNFVALKSGTLAVSLANDIIDRATDVASGKTLVLDVGAAAGSDADDIVETVVAGYDAFTGILPVTATVVPTEVIDTPVQDFPDVDNLGLPELGLALVERFPFCIPYDFVHLVSIFEQEPQAPYISIDIFPDSFKQKLGITGNTAFVIDLGSNTWSWIGTVSRWASLIGFCLVMFTLTKRLIWTS